MRSSWQHLRKKAVSLRKQGKSIGYIEKKLGIARSTLSGWLKEVVLTESQKQRLKQQEAEGLTKARIGAVKWHNKGKENRLNEARLYAEEFLQRMPATPEMVELALAFLYLGEGAKTKVGLSLGNSNPIIVKFYVDSICSLYNVPKESLKAGLHLRFDQDEVELKQFWSEIIDLPIEQFIYVTKDQRTAGRSTYSDYKGVCLVEGGGVAIQRKLMYLADMFCKRTIHKCAVSSAG